MIINYIKGRLGNLFNYNKVNKNFYISNDPNGRKDSY